MNHVAALSVVAVTVGLSLSRPKIGRVRIHHGTAGIIGAVLTILLGIGPPSIVFDAVKLLAAPVVTIVSLMIMTQVAERTGLFDRLAGALARQAGGNARRLFGYIFLAGTIVGTVFTNDAAVLIFTPIVFSLVEQIEGRSWRPQNKIPFYFAVLYVANLVGALLIANPINLVVANILGIGFVEFAWWMAFPAIVSVAVSFAGLWLYFRNWIPHEYSNPPPVPGEAKGKFIQVLCAVVVTLTIIGFFAEPVIGIPTWLVALLGSTVLLAVHRTIGRGDVIPVVRGVGWDVIAFMAGMFVVGLGLRQVGVTHWLVGMIEWLSGADLATMRFSVGMTSGACSAVINNHPTANLMAFTIQDMALSLEEKKTLAFAALIGGDLGPKMLPIGSLAALIWFRLLRDRGVDVPYLLYVRIGVPVTMAALVASLAVLELQLLLYTFE